MMVKYVYKAIVLLFVFVGALFLFGSNMAGKIFNQNKTVQMGDETFPYLTVYSCKENMNPLYGYSGTMDASIVRQSITPLDNNKSVVLKISEGKATFQKLNYKILDKESTEVYEDKTLNAIANGQKEINLTFSYALESSKEYILSLTATTMEGREIHYYTRLKYYQDDSNLDEKLKFAMKFHNATFSKDTFDNEMSPYLETKSGKVNNSLAKVDITSDQDMITWAKLSPEVLTDIVPVIKEYNMETACIQMNYFVRGNTSSGKEIFHVKEFFRIRYSRTRVFLLNYERTMEAEFDEKLASTKRSELKLGITQDINMDMKTSEDGKQLYFARNGVLYQYDMNKNEMNQVFSMFSKSASKGYRRNDENDIRLNKVDSDGTLYFTAFGYFPRGEYEGKVAVVLYRYSPKDNTLNELVYLPMDTTYQQMKEDFDSYSYVNSKNIYYFMVGNIVYSYNILGKRLEILKENVKEKSLVALKNNASYVWSSDLNKGYGDSITIYNLDTDGKKVIKAPSKNEVIRLFGAIDSNVVYGFAKKSDLQITKAGNRVIPCYRMEISDNKGNVLKTYQQSGKYISKVDINGNVLTMARLVRSTNGFTKISSDSILNQASVQKMKVSLTSRVTSASLQEWYIDLPYGFVLTKVPKLNAFDGKISTSERSVHLEEPAIPKYYVYALGQITGAYENPAEAVQNADKEMGVVVSSRHQVVWERGGSYLMNTVSGIEMKRSGQNVSNIAACAYMVLKANHQAVNADELTKSKRSVYGMLDAYLERPLNLSGISMEQALYFVSSGKPVIGMVSSSRAVVISGYTQTSVTVMNPDTGTSKDMTWKQAATMFKNAGNRFVSYMRSEND